MILYINKNKNGVKMISFREFLDEGVIKVPPKLFSKMSDFLVKSILEYHYDDIKNSDSLYIKRILKKYKIKSSVREPYQVSAFNYDLKSFSRNYDRSKTPRINMVVLLTKNSNMTGVAGRYTSGSKHGVAINAETVKVDYLKEDISRLINVLEHELMHSVQFNLLHPEQSQKTPTEKYPGASREELYLLSNVEFDPTILSALEDFKDLIDFYKKHTDSKDVKRDVFDLITTSKKPARNSIGGDSIIFFQTLYKYDKDRWKIAVKKFKDLVDKRYK